MKDFKPSPRHAAESTGCSFDLADGLQRGMLAAAVVLVLMLPPLMGSADAEANAGDLMPATPTAAVVGTAAWGDPDTDIVSADARQVADWATRANDNAGLAFFIIDKRLARVYAFDAGARLAAWTQVTMTITGNDEAVEPGRFMAERGKAAKSKTLAWTDPHAPTPGTHVAVPAAFYEAHIEPAFSRNQAVVYVLPEVKTVQQVFGAYDMTAAHRPMSDRTMRMPCSGLACTADTLRTPPSLGS